MPTANTKGTIFCVCDGRGCYKWDDFRAGLAELVHLVDRHNAHNAAQVLYGYAKLIAAVGDHDLQLIAKEIRAIRVGTAALAALEEEAAGNGEPRRTQRAPRGG